MAGTQNFQPKSRKHDGSGAVNPGTFVSYKFDGIVQAQPSSILERDIKRVFDASTLMIATLLPVLILCGCGGLSSSLSSQESSAPIASAVVTFELAGSGNSGTQQMTEAKSSFHIASVILRYPGNRDRADNATSGHQSVTGDAQYSG